MKNAAGVLVLCLAIAMPHPSLATNASSDDGGFAPGLIGNTTANVNATAGASPGAGSGAPASNQDPGPALQAPGGIGVSVPGALPGGNPEPAPAGPGSGGSILDPVISPLDPSVSTGIAAPVVEPPVVSHPIDSTLPANPSGPGALVLPAGPQTPLGSGVPEPSAPDPAGESAGQSASSLSLQRYAAGDTSIAFRPAEEVAAGDKIWGLSLERAQDRAAKSSTQFVFTGRVVSVDRYKQTVVLMDRHKNTKTLSVDAGMLPRLRRGAVVQATIRPGGGKAESIRQILGG